MFSKRCALLVCVFLASGCATQFPRPSLQDDVNIETSVSFAETFEAHGGKHLDSLQNLNVGITGRWKQLIRRIQPLVTDYTYRVESQERLLPQALVYAAHYTGPAGTKSVFRSPEQILVHYNGEQSLDQAVLSSTALTADAFHLFLLGPLALYAWQEDFVALPPARLAGQLHARLYLKRSPGFGFSDIDEVVLWVDAQTKLTRMIQITLEGHETTRGAHVEVEYLKYVNQGSFTFPSEFFERVNAPISIDAHEWRLTGLDINRDYRQRDLLSPGFAGEAKRPATKIPPISNRD
jgi:hypothetical protein